METPEKLDMATIVQMLQSFGISPDQLGPERLAMLQKLAAGFSDPSQISMESSQQIVDALGISTKGQVKQKSKKIGRNEPCTCGSKKKYKKCCLT